MSEENQAEATDQVEEAPQEQQAPEPQDSSPGFADVDPGNEGFADHGNQGTPESSPGDYSFQYPEDVDGEQINPELMDKFKNFAHQAGLTNEEAQDELNNHLYWFREVYQENQRQQGENIARWREESSRADLLNPDVMHEASRGLSMLDSTGEIGEILSLTGLQSHPVFIRVFQAYARRNSQGRGTMSPGTTPAPKGLSPDAEAEAWVGSSN